MPESFYFLSFWVLCWFLIRLDSTSNIYIWIVVGAIYGTSALIKPHAIFILPAIFMYMAYIFYRGGTLLSLRSFFAGAIFIFFALLIKMLVGYILAGSAGLTIFGPMYSSYATSTVSDIGRYVELLELTFVNIQGHFFAIALIYGLPFSLSVYVVVVILFKKFETLHIDNMRNIQLEKISFLVLALILNLIFVVGMFTASVVNSGPYESLYRLHLRYYNFALPLFYIVAAGAHSIVGRPNQRIVRCVIGSVVSCAAAYAIYTNLYPFLPSFIDSPEIRGIHVNLLYYRVIGGLLLLSLLFWIIFEKAGTLIYLYVALPLFVFTSYYHVVLEQRNRLVADVYDKAGMFAKQYLPKEDVANTLIVGSEPAGLYRSLFYLDNSEASLITIPRDSDLEFSELPSGKNWILIIGDHALLNGKFFQLSMNGFSLARVSGSNLIDFRKSAWPGVISKFQGLSSAESWGTWSNSHVAEFKFTTSLPEKFELHLVAHAFGPNVEDDFCAIVGSSIKKFRLSHNSKKLVLLFENFDHASSIKFTIPKPTSPKDLGLGADERKLGIAFVQMKVVSLEKAVHISNSERP
jgi:phosphoglycerol transferase